MTRRTRLVFAVGSLSLGAVLASAPLAAQPLREPARWVLGAAAGVLGTGRSTLSELFTIALHATHFAPGHLGLDLAVGTAPRPLAQGTLGLGLRLGGSFPVTLQSDSYLLPAAGLSTLLATGEGQAAAGPHVGVALLHLAPERWGWRAGVSWHRLNSIAGTVWLLELGLVR